MIFQILHLRKSIREARENPGKFGASQLMDVVKGVLIIPAIIALVVLVLLFIAGFTHLFGMPSGLARVFFFICLFPIVVITSILIRILKSLGRHTSKFVNSTIKEVSNIEIKEK